MTLPSPLAVKNAKTSRYVWTRGAKCVDVQSYLCHVCWWAANVAKWSVWVGSIGECLAEHVAR